MAGRADLAVDLETTAETFTVVSGIAGQAESGALTPGGRRSCSTWCAPMGTEWGEDCCRVVSLCDSLYIPCPVFAATNCGFEGHSPFLSGCHGIGVASVQVEVPCDGADREDGGASGEGVVLPGRASSLGSGGGGGGALYHPIRQQLHQWELCIL